ncbi:hypothetical protein E8E11_001315 [Didymella keratinophila]|nr:hypothetical protein E8E11_001315 [Didymella keratinophila]
MDSQHQPVVRPPLTVNPDPAHSPIHKNFSRQNSVTHIVETPVPQPDEAVLGPGDEKEKAELKRDEERRSIFQKYSNDVLNVPSGYRKVEVLIIRWDESIDDFKGHNNEIERLKMIFQTGYGFKCRIAAIKDDRDPQMELDWQIMSHVRDHDDENSLLIVYYTGHGNQVLEDGNQRRLELTAP